MEKVFTLKSSSILNKSKKYPLTTDMDNVEYIYLYNLLRELVRNWVDRERVMYKNNNEELQNNLVHNIENINLKKIADPSIRKSIVRILQDSEANLSFSRLLDLVTRIEMILPMEFIETIKGKLYRSVTGYGKAVTSLPNEEDWYSFIEKFSFVWILFIIQEIAAYPKEIFQPPS